MKTAALIDALQHLKVETGSLACLGCGHEHSCSVHGCAIIREAVDLIEKARLESNLRVLRVNDPLTKVELQEMIGEPVWVVYLPAGDGEWEVVDEWTLAHMDEFVAYRYKLAKEELE